jgi:putative ABC transport system permease protein
MLHDMKRAIHTLIHRPGFSAVVILTLGLGIGATSTIFSVVNRALLHPIPLPEPDRLIVVEESHPETSSHWGFVSPQNFRDWRERNGSFEALAAYQWTSMTLTGSGLPEKLTTMRVSSDFFRAVGVVPALGRGFLPSEDLPGGPKVAVLSHAFWKTRFGGDATIVGETLVLDREPHVVVGVAPEELRLPGELDIWVPLCLDYDAWPRDFRWAGVYGRLKEGVSLEAARADMGRIAGELAREHPATNTGWGVTLESLEGRMIRIAGPALLILSAAVAMVLAIAITNVATLLLSSGAARQAEVAIRQALGASRGRLLQQFLTESLVLAGLGGGLGLLVALWSAELLDKYFSGQFPQAAEAGVDFEGFGFTLLVSLAAGLAAGILPALRVSRSTTRGYLNEPRKSTISGSRSQRMRHMLVSVEVALALVLLIGASLLMRSFLRLLDVSPGFSAENVLRVELELPDAEYQERSRLTRFYQEILENVEALPGIVSAGIIHPMPLAEIGVPMQFEIEGQKERESEMRRETLTRIADAGYFETMKIPLIQGRLMRGTDRESTQPVLIVNQTFARRFFPGENAIGRRVAPGGQSDDSETRWHTIIGIVGDVRHDRLEKEAGPEVYFSAWQGPFRYTNLVVRSLADPVSTTELVRKSLAQLDPNLPISSVQTVEDIVADSLGRRRFTMSLLGLFASLALVLAAVGIYGVISHAVHHRLREVGIRMALGATRGEVMKRTLHRMMAPVFLGVALGLVGSLVLGRFLESYVYGIGTTDPLTFSSVTLVVLLVAFLAGFLPILRAARVDPMTVLRYE